MIVLLIFHYSVHHVWLKVVHLDWTTIRLINKPMNVNRKSLFNIVLNQLIGGFHSMPVKLLVKQNSQPEGYY